MVNGEPNKPFKAAKGLRQGDPISPYLIVVAMEYLSRLPNTLRDNKEFSYNPRCANLGITHLCFADDLLLLARGDLQSVITLMKCFDIFAQASGLQTNRDKSSIYFGGILKKDWKNII